MKKAIICFPKIDNIIWTQTQFPIGIYKIKQYCKKKYDVIILDERFERDIFKKIDMMLNESVLCLGLSVMTGEQITSAISISKKYHGKVKIVWGGVHPTILPDNVLREPYVDYVIRGDGEKAFLNLLTYLDKGRVENYFLRRDGMKKAFTIETSRGCPHQCAFCHNTILGHKYRTVNVEYIGNTIEYLIDRYNVDGIVFQEDNFFLDINRAKNVIKKLCQYRNIGWKANSRISYFEKITEDKEMMNDLVQSNCKVLQFGIESGSDRILKLINKKITTDQIRTINKKLSLYNIKLRYNFIIGFPTETVQEIRKTMEFIEKLMEENANLEPPFVNIYTPYPGTPIFDLAVKQGFKPP